MTFDPQVPPASRSLTVNQHLPTAFIFHGHPLGQEHCAERSGLVSSGVWCVRLEEVMCMDLCSPFPCSGGGRQGEWYLECPTGCDNGLLKESSFALDLSKLEFKTLTQRVILMLSAVLSPVPTLRGYDFGNGQSLKKEPPFHALTTQSRP